jgi:hypothetical protein
LDRLSFNAFDRKRMGQVGVLTRRRKRIEDLLEVQDGVDMRELSFQRAELMTVRTMKTSSTLCLSSQNASKMLLFVGPIQIKNVLTPPLHPLCTAFCTLRKYSDYQKIQKNMTKKWPAYFKI